MNLPRILVVDDQYARDPAEREVFLRHSGLVERGTGYSGVGGDAIGIAIFCSAQRRVEDTVLNDYEVVRDAVTQAPGAAQWAMVLLDVRFESGPPGAGGVPVGSSDDECFGEIIRGRLAEDFQGLPVVMLSSKPQRELECRKTPYLSKERLDERALTSALLRFGALSSRQVSLLLDLPDDVVAVSAKMRDVFRRALECSKGEVSVLLLGESGTGKEVVAQYIHRQSARRDGPFVAVNMAAIPADLLEAELFGHEKGAFTGATSSREGRFEQASGGTLFLDEIGDMPIAAQTKVLRALQEREVVRLGENAPRRVDIRLISATAHDLSNQIASAQFREDLYYRINTIPIEIPPLRDRPEDIAPLATRLIEHYTTREGKIGITLSPGALTRLQANRFSGNVRELENLIQRLLTSTGNNRVISEEEVSEALQNAGYRVPVDGTISELRAHQGSRSALTTTTRPRLKDLPAILDRIDVDSSDAALAGAKPRLHEALRHLMHRLAGACLERCRDPVSGELNRQRAMQLLTGDSDLKGKNPARVINQILGRRQDDPVRDEDLEELVRHWREGKAERL